MRRPQNTTKIGGTQLGRYTIAARPASTGSKAKGGIAAFQMTTAAVSPTFPLPGEPAPSFSSSSQQSTAALGMDGEERKKQKHPAQGMAPAFHPLSCSTLTAAGCRDSPQWLNHPCQLLCHAPLPTQPQAAAESLLWGVWLVSVGTSAGPIASWHSWVYF